MSGIVGFQMSGAVGFRMAGIVDFQLTGIEGSIWPGLRQPGLV